MTPNKDELRRYRCKGRYGWITIAATDHLDAMLEAQRSASVCHHLAKQRQYEDPQG